jgi:uncharacterized protein
MNLSIEHLADRGRFEAVVEGQPCIVEYRLVDGVMAITHTAVPTALEGRGIAGALVQALLDHAAAEGLKVRPLCSYAVAYLHRHPESAGLVA